MDAVTRTRDLLERQATIEDVVRDLRSEGFSVIESMSALIKGAGLTFAEAKAATVDSATWADERDRIETRRLIRPPQVPDQGTIDRLHAACGREPRIVQAWLIGSQMTRADGSSRETAGVALVLDPPSTDNDEQVRLIETLDAEATETKIGSWLFRSWKFRPDEAEVSVRIYERAE